MPTDGTATLRAVVPYPESLALAWYNWYRKVNNYDKRTGTH
jgi:hypothetical protein